LDRIFPIAESGLPAFEVTSWSGVFAPPKIPPEIVAKLNAPGGAQRSAAAGDLYSDGPGSPAQHAGRIGEAARGRTREVAESYRGQQYRDQLMPFSGRRGAWLALCFAVALPTALQ
jgi:hypothetical protein